MTPCCHPMLNLPSPQHSLAYQQHRQHRTDNAHRRQLSAQASIYSGRDPYKLQYKQSLATRTWGSSEPAPLPRERVSAAAVNRSKMPANNVNSPGANPGVRNANAPSFWCFSHPFFLHLFEPPGT
ncbi:hypothetical protein V8C34DRAFT_43335 [Trichoderma compactum]